YEITYNIQSNILTLHHFRLQADYKTWSDVFQIPVDYNLVENIFVALFQAKALNLVYIYSSSITYFDDGKPFRTHLSYEDIKDILNPHYAQLYPEIEEEEEND